MEREHVGKDVTCVPQYLGRMLGADVEIVSLTSATNRDFPAELDGIRYRFLFRRGDRRNGWYKYAFFWWYLIRNAKRIDILMRFHYSVPTMIETILYKMCNPRGKVYIKCDTDHHIISKFPPPKKLRTDGSYVSMRGESPASMSSLARLKMPTKRCPLRRLPISLWATSWSTCPTGSMSGCWNGWNSRRVLRSVRRI